MTYFVVWSVLAIFALNGWKKISATSLGLLGIFFSLFIGFRDNVGGDWPVYIKNFARFQKQLNNGVSPFENITEPGFQLIEYFSYLVNGHVWIINIICAILFTFGLLFFCKSQPRPWLALLLAFPYLIVVVSLGYTRQSVAISFAMIAITYLEKQKLLSFLAWVGLAGSFHRTALVLMGLALFTPKGKGIYKILNIVLILGTMYGIYISIFDGMLSYYYNAYFGYGKSSSGTFIRIILCVIPAVIFLLTRSKFNLGKVSNLIWTYLSLISILLLLSLVFVQANTAIDRLALYLIPIQMFVGSRFPDTKFLNIKPKYLNFTLVMYSFLILFGWINFARHASYWLPYNNLIISHLAPWSNWQILDDPVFFQ